MWTHVAPEPEIPEGAQRVLDNGYVYLIETWGRGDNGIVGENEAGIVEAARQSTQGAFRGWDNGDGKLIDHLMGHRHTTPFEFAGMTIEVQAPISVFREWQRHRTQSYNEMSARYAPLPNVNYVPTRDRIIDGVAAAGRNRQAQGVVPLQEDGIQPWLDALVGFYDHAEFLYQRGLETGIPKEVARVVLPVGRYSRMRASTDLWNWLHFLGLRTHPDAQWEIRQYARAVETLIAMEFPRTFRAWREGADEAARG